MDRAQEGRTAAVDGWKTVHISVQQHHANCTIGSRVDGGDMQLKTADREELLAADNMAQCTTAWSWICTAGNRGYKCSRQKGIACSGQHADLMMFTCLPECCWTSTVGLSKAQLLHKRLWYHVKTYKLILLLSLLDHEEHPGVHIPNPYPYLGEHINTKHIPNSSTTIPTLTFILTKGKFLLVIFMVKLNFIYINS